MEIIYFWIQFSTVDNQVQEVERKHLHVNHENINLQSYRIIPGTFQNLEGDQLCSTSKYKFIVKRNSRSLLILINLKLKYNWLEHFNFVLLENEMRKGFCRN